MVGWTSRRGVVERGLGGYFKRCHWGARAWIYTPLLLRTRYCQYCSSTTSTTPLHHVQPKSAISVGSYIQVVEPPHPPTKRPSHFTFHVSRRLTDRRGRTDMYPENRKANHLRRYDDLDLQRADEPDNKMRMFKPSNTEWEMFDFWSNLRAELPHQESNSIEPVTCSG